MIPPGVELAAQFVVGRVLNSLPEGLLLALSAWLLLRVMGRQNSGTRFAVWMVALLGVAALPFLSGSGSGGAALRVHAPITVSAFWAVAFSAVWIAAACLAFVRLAAGLWQVRRLRQGCRTVSPDQLDSALDEILRPVRRPVRLLVSDQARVPAAIGFLKPAIVLPAWTLRDLTALELKPILIHELAHLRRRDDWTNLLQKAVCAVFFFQPAVWWIDARLSLEREMACDDAVLAATGNPRGYAGCLISLLEKSCARRGWSMAQAAVARARDASLRIARILQTGAPASTRVGRGALALAGAACVTSFGVLLSTPQLLVFAPQQAEMLSPSALEAHYDGRLSPPGIHLAAHSVAVSGLLHAAVVPATFHPAQTPSLVHPAVLKHVALHCKPVPAVTLASAALPASQVNSDFVVQASLRQPQSQPQNSVVQPSMKSAQASLQPIMAGLQQPPPENQAKSKPAAAPVMFLVTMEIPQSSADVAPAAGKDEAGKKSMTVQELQIVFADETGVHVQIYRVVVVPMTNANEVQSHSI